MPIAVAMPVFGISAREATIQEWLKREGEHVRKGEPLLVVETEKATMEVPAPADGHLVRILVQAGETVLVQTPVAELAAPDEAAAPPPAEASTAVAALTPNGPSIAVSPTATAPAAIAPAPAHESRRLKATPLARKTARALRLDLNRISGSGPGGRILERDVRAASTVQAPEVAPAALSSLGQQLVTLSPVRRATAERMARSAHSAARVTLFAEADFSEATRLRKQLADEFAQRWQARLTYDALLARAAAKALARHPDVNSQWADGALRRMPEVNVGVAIQTDRGLLVPVIRRADALALPELARQLTRLFDSARTGRLGPDELSGSTFTITNLGGFQVDAFTPIINPPEAAVLGVGRIAARPANVDGQVALRETAVLALSFDHRVLDGVPAAEFLRDLRTALEQPYLLLMG